MNAGIQVVSNVFHPGFDVAGREMREVLRRWEGFGVA